MDNQNFKDLLKVRNVIRVALYIRVSTQEQVNEGYSVGEQTKRLTKYAEAMGWEVYKIYVDPGYSGGNTDRPGLNDMIKAVKAGELDKIVVYKLDRLSRSQLDTLYLIEKVFLANNTDFVSMSENFDTATPFGRAMIGILAVFAQLEREQIKERLAMGKEARAKEGKWHGGTSLPIGYDYNPNDDFLHVNKFEAMQVKEVFDLFIKGTPVYSIESIFEKKGYKHKYGPWTTTTIKKVLQNKTYLGYIKYKGKYYPSKHDCFIDKETFEHAQLILKDRADAYEKSGLKGRKFTAYLAGLIHCKHCGGKYTKNKGGSVKYGILTYYVCFSRCHKLKTMIKDPNCKNKTFRMEVLDQMVFDEIKKLATDPEYIQTIKDAKNNNSDNLNKLDIIKKEINTLDDQISRFMDLYGLGKFTIDQISEKIDPLNSQKKALERELENLVGEKALITDEHTIELVTSFAEILERGDFDEIRLVIESLIHYIEIDNDDVYIHWKFA